MSTSSKKVLRTEVLDSETGEEFDAFDNLMSQHIPHAQHHDTDRDVISEV